MYFQPLTGLIFADHSAIRAGVRAMFTETITDDDLAYHGVYPVSQASPVVAEGEIAIAGVPEEFEGGWRQTWTVRAATAEELAAALPESVPMLNLQLILIEDGKLATVEAILGGMTGDDGAKARAYWSKALTARRDNYLVAQLWPAIGYTAPEFKDAWLRAAALNP